MKYKITVAFLLCLSVTILCSCQNRNGNKEQSELPGTQIPDSSNNLGEQDELTNTEDIKENSKEKDNDDKNKVTSINTFVSLIGLTDEEVVKRIGNGIKEQENVGDSIVTREYPFHLQNVSLTAIVSYDNQGIVQGVYSFLPDTEKEKWEAYLTEELGEPTRVEAGNLSVEDGNYITNILWMVEKRMVALFGSHGSLSIQIE